MHTLALDMMGERRLMSCFTRLCPAGRSRRWDMIQSHGSVGIIIYHTEQQAFLMVRQFRPAVSITPLVPAAQYTMFQMPHVGSTVGSLS